MTNTAPQSAATYCANFTLRNAWVLLPDAEARAHMLQLKLGSKAQLQPAEYVELANMTEGYSGSDITVAAQEALMEPLRLVQNANYYSGTLVLH